MGDADHRSPRGRSSIALSFSARGTGSVFALFDYPVRAEFVG